MRRNVQGCFAEQLVELLQHSLSSRYGAYCHSSPRPQAPAKKVYTYADMTLCHPQLVLKVTGVTASPANGSEVSVKLIFSDAQQKQENQISAIRSCIQQGVNVIALCPVVETGWDAVLSQRCQYPGQYCRPSGILADPKGSAHIGSDMEIEGKRSAEDQTTS